MSHVLRSNLFRWIVLLVACATLSVAALAQSTVTGAVAGTVTDPSKAVVVGAKVTVRNLDTNVQQSATTDAQGKFRVLQLQPGTYTVIAEAANFAPAKVAAMIVEVGRVTELEMAMSVAGKTEAVEVTADAPLVNTMQQDFTSNLNQDAIKNIPINGRRWSMYALMTPGATPDGGFGLISFRGISGLLNNNTVDGGDNNQAFFSEERGRTRLSYTVSQSSIREFQVNTSNYSAEYGRAAGGVVNSVTKSGTNNLHGEGFYYIRDNTFGATNPFNTIYTKNADGTFTATPFKPEDRRHQFGGNLGGPIIKDKVFFFFNYDGQRRNFPGNAILSGNPPSALNPITLPTTLGSNGVALGANSELANIVNHMNLGKVGGCATGTWPACVYNDPTNTFYQQALAYGNGALGFIQAETGPVPRTGDQDIFFPKIDWRVTQNNTFSVSYNRLRWNSPAGIQTQPTNTYGVASFGDDYVKTDTLNARLTSTLSNNMTNELRYHWGRDFEFQNSQPPSAAEISPCQSAGLSITNCPTLAKSTLGGGARVPYLALSGGINLGRPNFLERAKYPDETQHQFTDTVNLVHGKHLLKFGIDMIRNNDAYSNLYQGGGQYSYSGTYARVNFITDLMNYLTGAQTLSSWFSNYYQAFGPLGIEFHTWDYGTFVQDDYRVLPRLTLSLGMRYEYEQAPKAMYPNPQVPASTRLPQDRNNFGPRFGFAYDVFGNGKTSLRGGYGMYYGRINNGAIGNVMFNSGATGTQRAYSFSYSSGIRFPDVFCGSDNPVNCTTGASVTASVKPAVAFFDPKMQNPQIHQVDLSIQQEVAKNTVVEIDYLGSLGRQLPQFIDTNIAPATRTQTYLIQGGPLDGQTFTTPFYTSRINSNYGTMMDVQSSINSSYNALVAQLNRRMTNGLQFSMNYTWSHAMDDGQNSQTQTASYMNVYDPYNLALEHGTSNFDVRHRFVSSVVWQPQYFRKSGALTKAALNGWSLAPLVTISSGKPYTEGISGNSYQTFGSTSYNYGANGGVNGAGGVYRVAPLLGRNTFRYPNFANIDLRLSRIFNVTERQKVEFIAEAFNLFNSQQITGLTTNAYVTAAPVTAGGPAILSYANTVPGFAPFGSFNQAGTNLYRERQIQFAVRYSF